MYVCSMDVHLVSEVGVSVSMCPLIELRVVQHAGRCYCIITSGSMEGYGLVHRTQLEVSILINRLSILMLHLAGLSIELVIVESIGSAVGLLLTC